MKKKHFIRERHVNLPSKDLFQDIKALLSTARNQVIHAVNSAMVNTYFEIGRMIVEHEQKGHKKALYGKETLKDLSHNLTHEFGKGFSVDNLENMRKFYLTFKKSETLSRKFALSWSHYVFLIRLNELERKFYEIEATENNWSLRELKRQFDAALFDRLRLSRTKDEVKALSEKGQLITKPQDAVKDPYVLEFLGLKEETVYSENQLEQAIIDKIEHFLLELGKGFAFIGRQQRFTFDEEHFFVDLVFYNRLLKCFVLIDLKIGDLKHQDLGQIQMYVNYYDRLMKTKDENPTIGIVLCKDKKDSLVEITLPKDNRQIFASQYQIYLPTKEELIAQLEKIDEK
jgi:predicted nuclease of restriction endonuclease-like (RecB) superfamily